MPLRRQSQTGPALTSAPEVPQAITNSVENSMHTLALAVRGHRVRALAVFGATELVGKERTSRIQAGPDGPATSIVSSGGLPGCQGPAPTCRAPRLRRPLTALDAREPRISRNSLVWTLLWTSLWTSTTESGVHDNHLPHTPSTRSSARVVHKKAFLWLGCRGCRANQPCAGQLRQMDKETCTDRWIRDFGLAPPSARP